MVQSIAARSGKTGATFHRRCPLPGSACWHAREGGIPHALLNLTLLPARRRIAELGIEDVVAGPSRQHALHAPAGQCMAKNRAFTSRCLPTPTRSTAVFASIVLGPMTDNFRYHRCRAQGRLRRRGMHASRHQTASIARQCISARNVTRGSCVCSK